MQYVGIDWGTRRAVWCSFDECGDMVEGSVSADADGLAHVDLAGRPPLTLAHVFRGPPWPD